MGVKREVKSVMREFVRVIFVQVDSHIFSSCEMSEEFSKRNCEHLLLFLIIGILQRLHRIAKSCRISQINDSRHSNFIEKLIKFLFVFILNV